VDPRRALGRERGDVRLHHLLVELGRLREQAARLRSVLLDVDFCAGPYEFEREVGKRVGPALEQRVGGEVLLSAEEHGAQLRMRGEGT
jgi:hypothetical protein